MILWVPNYGNVVNDAVNVGEKFNVCKAAASFNYETHYLKTLLFT